MRKMQARCLSPGDLYFSEIWDEFFTVESISYEGEFVRITVKENDGYNRIRSDKEVTYIPSKENVVANPVSRLRDYWTRSQSPRDH